MFTGAFIFMSKSACSDQHNTQLSYGKERILIFGVSTVEEGIGVAKRIAEEESCRIIDLCGGFDEAAARAVRQAVGDKALVGYTTYFSEDAKLKKDVLEELTNS